MKEEKKLHWKSATGSKYLGAYMIEEDTKIKLLKVSVQKVTGENGREDEAIVAEVENNKPFIINKTNAKQITKIIGSPYLEDWAGQTITIYPTTTKLKGEVVECLRVKEPKPELTTKHPNFKQIQEAIKKGAYSLEQVSKKYDIDEATLKLLTK